MPGRATRRTKGDRRRLRAGRTGVPDATESDIATPVAAGRRLQIRMPGWLDVWIGRLPWVARRRAVAGVRRSDVLAAVPFRNERIEWELREPDAPGESPVAVLRIPRRQDRLARLLDRVFEAPTHKQVLLDELGTEVWCGCDGEHSVDGLIRSLARKHRLERREVEVSLTAYLRTLAGRGYIGLRLQGRDTAGEPDRTE
jgi:hypothetical protein